MSNNEQENTTPYDNNIPEGQIQQTKGYPKAIIETMAKVRGFLACKPSTQFFIKWTEPEFYAEIKHVVDHLDHLKRKREKK